MDHVYGVSSAERQSLALKTAGTSSDVTQLGLSLLTPHRPARFQRSRWTRLHHEKRNRRADLNPSRRRRGPMGTDGLRPWTCAFFFEVSRYRPQHEAIWRERERRRAGTVQNPFPRAPKPSPQPQGAKPCLGEGVTDRPQRDANPTTCTCTCACACTCACNVHACSGVHAHVRTPSCMAASPRRACRRVCLCEFITTPTYI